MEVGWAVRKVADFQRGWSGSYEGCGYLGNLGGGKEGERGQAGI